MTENDVDHVILKSDGIPTYHFAHAVDDHLMRTTHVVRDESWLSTLPFHIQLFKALGFKLPKYCHTAQVLKLDDGNKRKISKRKDPEAALTFYHAEGYPAAATREYLMTLLNSNFEEWRIANPTADIEDFKFTTKKMSVSGSLFDLDKLNDVSKNVISRMTAEEAYRLSLAWAKEFDPAFAAIYGENGDYGTAILAIGRGGAKPRKDLTTWKDVKDYVSFFYDALFTPDSTLPENVTPEDAAEICRRFAETYDPADDQPAWFAKIKQIAADLGYAPETKLYKKDPSAYKGHVGDVSMVLRIAVTGRQNSPDLFEVMHILGCERTIARLSAMIHTKKD